MNRVRTALRSRQFRCGGTRDHHHLIFLAHDAIDSQCGVGGRYIDQAIDAIDIEPPPGDSSRQVSLVLVIGNKNLDIETPVRCPEILDRLFRAGERRRAVVAIWSG